MGCPHFLQNIYFLISAHKPHHIYNHCTLLPPLFALFHAGFRIFFAWNFKQIFSPFYNAVVSHEKFETRQKQKTIFQLYRLFMCRRFNCILYAYSTISALKCQVLSWRCIKAKIRPFNAVKVNSPTARFRTVEEFFPHVFSST